MTRKPLGKGTYGPRGTSVRIWTDGDLVRAEWREKSGRKTKSWPNTAENRTYVKAWAKEFASARLRPELPERLTTRELWQRYWEAEEHTLRPSSQRNYRHYWQSWEVFVTPHSIAEDLGVLTMTDYRTDRAKHGWAPNTIAAGVRTVKTVYAWGEATSLLGRNDVQKYRFKVAKEQRAASPDEYSQPEWDRILAAIPLDQPTSWRARAVLELCGLQGPRQNAVLRLQWADLDLDAGQVVWRAQWDKTGTEWGQPLRARAVEVIRAVRAWHDRLGLDSPWLFPAASKKNTASPVYSAQSLWAALRKAEDAAGVPHRKGRGAHGARRMVFGNVLAATGNIGAAMDAINDRDLKVARRYHKARQDGVREAFEKLDRSGNATATAPDLGSEADSVTGGD